MPRKKWIDKSTSTTFSLVHRPQNDPALHDASTSAMVFQELAPTQSHKAKSRRDLEADLFNDKDSNGGALRIRDNEGEAAEYGVYYDDTEYDYMQHMKDMNAGTGDGQSYFVEAPAKKQKKGKAKLKLEDALREASLEDDHSPSTSKLPRPLLDEDVLPSTDLKKGTYQDQQNMPDALAGFQPDMDPRLREVLEALDDDAYVDDEEDIFGEIARDGKEVTLTEFEDLGAIDAGLTDDDGWETDGTEKPLQEHTPKTTMPPAPATEDITMEDTPDHGDGDWMKNFCKFKKAHKPQAAEYQAANPDIQSSILTSATSLASNGRRKKRKGAMTSSTGYSMTSSSLFRTEGQTVLDARFDRIEEEYAEDDIDDGASVMTGITGRTGMTGFSTASSQAPVLASQSNFDSMMDDFLGNYSMCGKKRIKKGGYQSGMEQLDDIRKGLGPARLKAQMTS